MTRSPAVRPALLILLVVVLTRLPALWTPILDVDESQFAGYANALLDGGLPYIASVDTKPLGIYWFFVACFALFGQNNMIAVHVATMFVVFGTAMLCRRIAATLFSERAGWLAALFYAVFTTTYIPKFISTSITIVMMLPLTASIWLLIDWEERRRDRSLLLAGLLFGVACLFKYQAGINLILVALYFLFFAPLYLRDEGARPTFRPLLLFLAGGVAIGAAFALYLVAIGVWEAFLFWSIEGSQAYIEAGAHHQAFLWKLLVRGGGFVASGLLLWLFGLREISGLARHLFVSRVHHKRRLEEYLILFWFLLSLVPVLTGGRFFGHYFIQLLPPLCIMAAAPAARALERVRQANPRVRRRTRTAVAIGLLLPAVGFFVARLFAGNIYAAIGEDDPGRYRPLGQYVQERTAPDETLFVWGFATPVYFFADRPAASRFLWCDWLTGRIPGSPTARDRFFDTTPFITRGSWEMLFTDLERSKPTYVVDTAVGNYHDYGKYPVDKYPPLVEYLKEHYTLEGRHADADFYRRKTNEGGSS